MCSGAENSNGLKWRENYWSDYEYFDLENDTRHPIHFVCSLFCPKNNKMAFVLFQCQQQGCQKWQQLKKATTKLQLQKVDQNLLPKSWPKFSFKILTKIQLQNLDQTSESKCVYTNILPQNLDKISALISWPNRSLKVLTKNTLLNLG